MRATDPRRLIATSAAAAAVGLVAAALGGNAALLMGANVVAVATGLAAWHAATKPEDNTALIAEVSHELRTPLTGILGTLELLTESAVPLETAEIDELMISAHGEANHLLHVVNNLHARSRLDREMLTPELAATNVRTIVDRAIARSPQVARRCYLSPGDTATALGDPQLIMQVVTNLVQNIERYAPDGEVRVTFTRTGSQMAVSFIDSGPGIAPERRDYIFQDGASAEGLGLGLSLSRQLARAMHGDLVLGNGSGPGAVFTLSLPASDEDLPTAPTREARRGDRATAYSPRARLLVDLSDALTQPTLDHVVGGIQRIYGELLGATGATLLVSRRDGSFYRAGAYASGGDVAAGSSPELESAIAQGNPIEVKDVATIPWANEAALGGRAALLLPVHDGAKVVAVLAVGWKGADAMPEGSALNVATALADMTAPAIARTALARDVVFERRLRASVMDELPIAVSVFAGDPPEVIDWNRKERELLGIDSDIQRPHDLSASQRVFDVRFADGTPLTVHNAPVSRAINTGKATGPFILLVKRVDGSQVHTRTYCAPFFDEEGGVSGAVVTSEPLDIPTDPNV